jgi:spore coat polysaccharide biosynthesis protein SpsF
MEITQRTASLSDADQILAWRNDPRVREFSLNTASITYFEHVRWLIARLKRVQIEPFFIFETEGSLIGMSRLDLLGEYGSKYEISILVGPTHQSQGIGTLILKRTCESISSLNFQKPIIAKVHKDNAASQRLFKKAGFSLLTSYGDFFEFEKT